MKKNRVGFYALFLCVIILLFISIAYFIVSHSDNGIMNDREIIEDSIKRSGCSDFNDVNYNAELAISKYEKKSIDPEPVFILARIRSVTHRPSAYLDLLTYDEDGDLLGIVIEEKYLDLNGNVKIIEEDYPVFTFWSPGKGVSYLTIFATTRNPVQLKDEVEWNKYLAGEIVETSKITTPLYWVNTLPEFLVSVPDRNKTEVEMYLYDKAGHKSKPILLRHVEVPLLWE